MRTILPFDELNSFKANLSTHFEKGRIKSKEDCEDIIDEILDLLLLAYANGVQYIDREFNVTINLEPTAEELNDVIYREVAGETWEQRVRHWYEEGGTEEDIVRIAETESHRVGNESAYKSAKQAGAKTKRWECMMMPTSRDTHIYLNGVTIPIDAEFYTFNGNKAMYPGQFGVAEEDINCLCTVQYR